MPRSWWRPRRDGLAVRVAGFLSLALLPIGLIAIYQTYEFQRESEERVSLSLLAVTEDSAAGVQQAIERALGAAESLGLVADVLGDPATCSGTFSRYVQGPNPYAFVGLLPPEGPVTCSSAAAPFELGERADMASLMADQRPRVRLGPGDFVAGADVIVVLSPLAIGAGGAGGYLGLSIPSDRIEAVQTGTGRARPLHLITFNQDGSVLTSDAAGEGGGEVAPLLPVGQELAQQAQGEARSFLGRDASGRERLYTVTPLVPDVAYAMAIWSPLQAAAATGGLLRAPLLFAVLMWGVSLVVAFWALHRFVIRPVAGLGRRMRRFGLDRTLPEALPANEAAYELREIDEAFRHTAESILHDEARMENAFHERGVLLREVHHRVKNNLQLISSIISMQVRRAGDPGTRALLRRLQDRVLTLATIYRSLYTSADMAEVNVAPVLRAIVEQEVRDRRSGADVTVELDDIVLDPDQVVPLAFFAAEAMSNALAHVGAAEGASRLSVSLARTEDLATFAVANTMPGPVPTPLDEAGQGLGQHLIRAFAAQVGAPAEIVAEEGTYRISLTFPIDPAVADKAA